MRKRTAKIGVSELVLGLSCATAGFTAAVLLVGWPQLVFEWKLRLGEIVSAVVTIVVALFVAWVLQRRGAEDRAEREILMRRAEKVLCQLNGFDQMVVDREYDYLVAAASVRQVRMAVTGLASCLAGRGYTAAHGWAQGMGSSFGELRDLLTGFAPRSGRIKKNRVTLDHGNAALVSQQIEKLRNEFYELMLEINSA